MLLSLVVSAPPRHFDGGRLRYGSGARQFHVCNAIRVALAVVLLASASSAGTRAAYSAPTKVVVR